MRVATILLCLGGILALARPAVASTPDDPRWDTRFYSPGFSSTISVLATDPAGVLYAGGSFVNASGDPAADYLVRWNGTRWVPVGGGVDGGISSITFSPDGDLVVGGSFTHAGGAPAPGVARWNGSTWSGVGSDPNRVADVVGFDSMGRLYAAGRILVDSYWTNYIAQWDGTSWAPMGSGIPNDPYYRVWAMAADDAGGLYVGGDFLNMGGTASPYIAKWDGSSWSAVGSGTNRKIITLAWRNATLYAGGHFTIAGGVSAIGIATWNGSTWSPMGAGSDNPVNSIALASNGDLLAAGDFATMNGVAVNHVARWNTVSWAPVGAGVDAGVPSLAIDPSGTAFVIGGAYVWRSTSGAWQQLVAPDGLGITGAVTVLAHNAAGDVFAGGVFTAAGTVPVRNIARWNGTSWAALGSGTVGTYSGMVRALAFDPAGRLYAGGQFQYAGDIAAQVARWDGTSWSAVGSTSAFPAANVDALVFDAGGTLYGAGGGPVGPRSTQYAIEKWNGTSWVTIGVPDNEPLALAADEFGNVYVGGWFTTISGAAVSHIARWDGTKWSALGAGTNDLVEAIVCGPAGRVYAAGRFTMAGVTPASCVASWNGTTWSALGSGCSSDVTALTIDATGQLYAVGGFSAAGGVLVHHVARWDGTAWSALGSGTDGFGWGNAATTDAAGNLLIGGGFTSVGDGIPSQGIAMWHADQPVATLVAEFAADARDDGIEVRWRLADPGSATAVTLERASSAAGPWTAVAAEPRTVGGTIVTLDRDVVAGVHYAYRLAWSTAGNVQTYGPVEATALAPAGRLAIVSFGPTPTPGPLRIVFEVPAAVTAELRLLDVQGRCVAELARSSEPGRHEATWTATPPHAGVYFVQLRAGGREHVRRVVVAP